MFYCVNHLQILITCYSKFIKTCTKESNKSRGGENRGIEFLAPTLVAK